ncbi:MAG: PAS domain-containing protein [Pseudolabrys sp.]|nr:PAS domain-containing protein [Pseudolabrys sp.]
MTSTEEAESGSSRPDEPIIVAMGASAGGVRALQTFFSAIPADTGAAFVVVVHLDPDRHSELPAILQQRTGMSVVQVKGRQKLNANCVYVIPPDRRLEMVDHEITAVAFDEPHGKRSPIDQFFRSVADRLGDGFAVIMSGAGSDGVVGVRAVKESGGIILVQDPAEAEYHSMPRSAMATGVVDVVLPVRELAVRLADLIRLKRGSVSIDEAPVDEEAVRRVLAHVRVRTGHDFSKYKRSTVLRRIARRMQVTRTDELTEYYDFLRDNADESAALLADLLISVTTFFRDNDAYEAMRKMALPHLFDERDPSDVLRIWACGCATGEEAYSIAMLLLEEAGRHDLRPPIQVFASDLDARALSTAREGRYPAAIEADVSEDRLRRFFNKEGDGYRVRQELRDVVLFAHHDLLKDPPFSRVELISCRNVMIYLDRELQEQVCSTFNYALNPGGYLLLGSSETADHPPGLFRTLDRNARLYQSVVKAGEKPRLLPRLLGPIRVREQIAPIGITTTPAAALNDAMAHRRALERVAPPSILVDEGHRVIHLSDSAGRFLQPSGGALTGDVVDLVRTELRFELRSALHRLFEQQLPSLSLPIPVRFNGKAHRVLLQVKSAENGDTGEPRQAVVMFVEGEEVDETVGRSDEHSNDETVRRLTQELELTQSRLRTVREESDAANEELRAANEELQSINEEYRSTSEELETSKEELQSINEELQTVNSELKLKLEAISRAHSDLQNLMAATDFGTLFLDSSLRIKRFTERATELFSITPSDEGRPITDFAHQLQYDDLIKDARAVLTDLAPIRREMKSRSGKWYDVRFRPYRTVDDKIDGVVITFVDISERRQVEDQLRESERQLRELKKK